MAGSRGGVYGAMTDATVGAAASIIDFGHTGIARYSQLGAVWRRRIESGAWPVGSRIPTVAELSAQYGVARETVRQALAGLARDGLIERQRARGTFVTSRPPEQSWCEMPLNWHGLLLPAEGATLQVLDTARGRQPARLPADAGRPAPSYRYWRRLHSRDGAPFYVGDAYIDERVCKRVSARALQTKTSMRILGDAPGVVIADARQTLTVGCADPETARLLGMPINAPIAKVLRWAIDRRGDLLYVGEGIFRGDVIRLQIKLK